MFCCALIVGLASCGDSTSVQILTASDSGSVIDVAAGSTIEVRLESNASTGYRWQLSAMSTPGLLELVTSTYEDEGDGDIVGSPGTEVFTFEAGAGAGILRLEYLRPFEDPPVPERVVEYIIRIDDAPWPPE